MLLAYATPPIWFLALLLIAWVLVALPLALAALIFFDRLGRRKPGRPWHLPLIAVSSVVSAALLYVRYFVWV